MTLPYVMGSFKVRLTYVTDYKIHHQVKICWAYVGPSLVIKMNQIFIAQFSIFIPQNPNFVSLTSDSHVWLSVFFFFFFIIDYSKK